MCQSDVHITYFTKNIDIHIAVISKSEGVTSVSFVSLLPGHNFAGHWPEDPFTVPIVI